ncbi:hypothetical protein [Nocardioides aquiterrae]|uniref:Uncharacterized protein n=1 Tax=Nocardioides aquiterrae TaxID=203799 RepID=A0ABN1UEY9_9ACTN
MTVPAQIRALLECIDEEYEDLGYVGLYQFSWCQRSPEHRPPQEEVAATARAAYQEFRRRTPTTLVWLPWPPGDLSEAVPAAEGTEIELDLDPEGPVRPFLALIPAP